MNKVVVRLKPEKGIKIGSSNKYLFDPNVAKELITSISHQEVDEYVASNAKPEIDKYIDNTAKPSIDSYVEITTNPSIDNYVETTTKPEINEYVKTEAKPLVTTIVNDIAEPLVNEYIETTTKPYIDDYVESKKPELQAYVTQAEQARDESVASATASAGSASSSLASANNAKTSETNAGTSATNASNSASLAQGYASDAETSLNELKTTATDNFNTNASQKTTDFDNNYESKLSSFNSNATTKTNDFNSNATQKTEQVNAISSSVSALVVGFDENVATKTSEFNQNATNKTASFDSNATQQANDFNSNALSKTNTFNSNADSKTQAFNTNASEKQSLVDAGALSAQTSATNAENSEANAKTSENNAKSYSEQAESSATKATQMSNSASTYATTATTQAGIATTQAGIATTKAQEASESASTATSKASIATTKAQEASTSATNASSSATSAGNSADLSESWAVGDKTSRPEGSAKYWAEKASAGQKQADWNQTDDTQVDFIKNKPTKLSQFTNDTSFVNTTQLATKQDISNLSQTIDTSTSKYPSNNAVKTAIDNIDALPQQGGNSGKFLTTDGTNASWEYAQSNKIGEIIQMACTSGYIPDGCLPCDGAEYAKSQFSDLWTNFLTSSPAKLNVCTYEQYQSDISTYGQCAKFAVDATNNKFKVPTIKDGAYITQALSDSELGKSYNESLPNLKGDVGLTINGGIPISGVFYSKDQGNALSGGSSYNWGTKALDASRYSSTYQDDAKVQGDNVRMRFFVVVANGQINQSMMDWSAWASSLNGKANADLSNMNPSQSAKQTIVGWGMPDYSAGISVSSYPFTAPSDGVLVLSTSVANGETSFFVNGSFASAANSSASVGYFGTIDLQKSDVVTVSSRGSVKLFYNSSTGTKTTFYPFKGVN